MNFDSPFSCECTNTHWVSLGASDVNIEFGQHYLYIAPNNHLFCVQPFNKSTTQNNVDPYNYALFNVEIKARAVNPRCIHTTYQHDNRMEITLPSYCMSKEKITLENFNKYAKQVSLFLTMRNKIAKKQYHLWGETFFLHQWNDLQFHQALKGLGFVLHKYGIGFND